MGLIINLVKRIFLPNIDLSISDSGIAFICKFESLSLISYKDEKGIWTIGWGHTENVVTGMRITVDQAKEYLRRDLLEAQNAVRIQILVPLNQNQYDALVSFTFNVGIEALKVSTLRRLLNNGDYKSVPDQMMRWNKENIKGIYKVSNGLTKRRQSEGNYFRS